MRLRLSPIGPIRVQSITIIAILHRAGMSLINARRAVEGAWDGVECWVEFKGDAEAIHRELAAVGFRAVTDDKSFVVGSGNYLADRGYADPEETRVRFLLANEIELAKERRGLSQPSQDVSSVSIATLIQQLLKLGRDVTICVSEGGSEQGRFDVSFIEGGDS